MHRYSYLTICLLSCIALAACKMPATQGMTEAPPPKPVAAPKVIPVPKKQSPDDIKLVTAALIEKLRGGSVAVDNVTFDPAGTHSIGESGFFYDGFDAHNIGITGYVINPLETGKAMAMLEGVILFKDVINRRAGVYFAAQYLVTRKGVTITKSVTRGLPSDFPRVETFFVPESKLRAAASSLTNYVDYYLFAIENAEPMTYGEDGSKTGINSKYVIMTFSKDRLFQESALSMVVTSKAGGSGTQLAKGVSINDSGWRILMTGGEFAPGSSKNKFYVTVTYKQAPSTHLPAVVVGEYSNVKSQYVDTPQQAPAPAPSPAPAQAPAASATQAAPATPGEPAPAAAAPQVGAVQQAPIGAEGPLALGRAFLNPVFPEDVEVIQVRLKSLGLYNGQIDRDFGPRTKKALDRFNVKHGFPKGQWSLSIQKALFKGTGQ